MSPAHSRESVETTVTTVLARASSRCVEEILPEHRLRDLGIDSLNRRAILVVIEAELDVALNPVEFDSILDNGTASELIHRVNEVAILATRHT